MSVVLGYLIVSAKTSCRDIMYKLKPGSPPLFLFFTGMRGERGNEAINEPQLPEKKQKKQA